VNVPGRVEDRHNWEDLTPQAAFVIAAWVVDRAVEVREVLEPRLNWHRRRQISLRTLLIAKEMLGMLGRRSHHRQVRLVLRCLPLSVQRHLNVVDAAGQAVTYRQIEKAMTQIAKVLADPTVLVDHDHPPADAETGELLTCPVTCPYMAADHNWYTTAMARASRPDDIPVGSDMSMDWTDMETWARPRFRFSPDAPREAGDVGDDYHSEVVVPRPRRAPASQAPIGPDGRRITTKDGDARQGHRSPRPGVSPYFVGWDNNTLVGAPDRDGSPAPAFTYAVSLVPASSYAADAAITLFRQARHVGIEVRDLMADRGYTRLDPNRFARPVRSLVDNIVLDLLELQRRRGVDFVVVREKGTPTERTVRIKRIAGGFFASGLPDDFDNLARAPKGAPRPERELAMAEFDKRARFAFMRNGRADSGAQRWAGPASEYAKFKVRCPNNERSMRAPNTRPLTSCEEGSLCSCSEVLVIDDPSSAREQQRLLWGTTKWEKSYGRRTTVERAYADDTVQVTNFDRKSIYCFGTVKHALYYSPILVARNIQVALRWYRDHGQTDPWDIERICQPDFELRLERHLETVGGAPLAPTQAAEEGPAEPTSETLVADAGPLAPSGDAAPTGPAVEDPTGPEVAAGPTAPRLNRAQRRSAARQASKQRLGKPPKPPPAGQSPDDQ